MPWYFGWNVIGAAMVFQAVIYGLGVYCFTLWVTDWTREFGVGRAEIMIATTLAAVIHGLVSPMAGKALDRLSIRAIVCIGALCFAVGLVALSFATALWHVLLIYATLIAGGLGLAGPLSAQTLAAKWFRARRNLAVGLVSVGTSIGGFVLSPLVAWMLPTFGWRESVVYLGVGSAVAIIPLCWWLIADSPEQRGIAPEAEAPPSARKRPTPPPRPWTTSEILRSRSFQVTAVAFVPAFVGFSASLHNLGPLARDVGMSPAQSGLLMSLVAGTTIFGKVLFGVLTGRFDVRWLFGLAAASLSASMLLAAWSDGFAALAGAAMLLGFGAGGFLPVSGTIVSTRFGPHVFGQVMGLLWPFFTFSALGPVVSGWVRDSTGSYDVALYAFAAAIAAAALAMKLLPPAPDTRDANAAVDI